jgi:RimJ/RimL family protein N-acetyltransferase
MTTLYYDGGESGGRIGMPLDFSPPPYPRHEVLQGAHIRAEPLTASHAAELIAAFTAADDAIWTWLPYGPFTDARQYARWICAFAAAGADPQFYALRDLADGQAAGVASYLNIHPAAGSIEVGHICLAARMQKTRAATEAMFLLMQNAFALGYRRYEWKCNALNEKSCRAAERLGLSFEGVFRQAAIAKNRNRDTAWFAAVDGEWPALRRAYQQWLSDSNFAADGKQKRALADLTAPIISRRMGESNYRFARGGK